MERKFTDLTPEEVEMIVITTSGLGPFAEDLHYLIFGKGAFWRIPNSLHAPVMQWLKRFPDVDYEQAIRAAGSTTNRAFLLWRREGPPTPSEGAVRRARQRLGDFLGRHFEAPSGQLDAIAEKIISAYRRPERLYHGLGHVLHGLWELDALPGEGVDRAAIELAIWYHDLVYVPGSKTNEAESAGQLRADLGGFPTRIPLEKVAAMIRDSGHAAESGPRDEDTRLFLDIDLSILGRGKVEYLVYRQSVREEYNAFSGLRFHYGRKKLLKQLLRTGIFSTEWFKARYESQARANIADELKQGAYRFIPVLTRRMPPAAR